MECAQVWEEGVWHLHPELSRQFQTWIPHSLESGIGGTLTVPTMDPPTCSTSMRWCLHYHTLQQARPAICEEMILLCTRNQSQERPQGMEQGRKDYWKGGERVPTGVFEQSTVIRTLKCIHLVIPIPRHVVFLSETSNCNSMVGALRRKSSFSMFCYFSGSDNMACATSVWQVLRNIVHV